MQNKENWISLPHYHTKALTINTLMVKLEQFSFMLPDLLQPQEQEDLSWRCVCTDKSFPSEPESSEA